MKTEFIMGLAFLALTVTQGQADPGVETLYKTVHKKVDRHCPPQLSAADVDSLKDDTSIKVGKVTYQRHTGLLGQLDGDAAYLCTGQYLKYSSSRPKVICTYCNEQDVTSEKALVSISVRVGGIN